MNTRTIAAVAAGTIAAAGFAGKAHAFEGNVAPYPAGAAGTNIGSMPPIPGIFALEQFNYSFANGLYGNDGRKLPVPFHSSAFSETTRVLVAYPVTVLGANVYSQLVVPVVCLHTNVAGNKSTQNGLSNITVSPVILKWDVTPNFAISPGLDFAFETGSYSPTKTSVAEGYLSIQPVLSIRYNVPNGIDVGLSSRLMLNQKNGDTGYRSGTGYAGEFQAGWNFGKWKLGVVGAYVNQFGDDELNGVTVATAGNRYRSFAIGPSIAYDGRWYNISMNYQQGVYAANTSKSSNVWLNLAFPLWAPHPQ
ncbi:Transporter [Paraburkholderia kururiensis]|uniref:SphA family protein n=1 Tax=Paraburkholderia kururiensis TaxID=984307 RepID=UPI0039A5543E